jgi:putative nucleotidyltransferase with HDIG domain
MRTPTGLFSILDDGVHPVAPTSHGDASVLFVRAQQAQQSGQRAVARHLFEQALWASEARLTSADVAGALLGIARSWQDDGQSDVALDCLELVVAIGHAFRDFAMIGAALNMRAVIDWQHGRLDDAEHTYVAAQEHGEQAGDRRLVAMVAQNRGVIATVRGEFTRALGHYRESLSAYHAQELHREACGVLNNIGMVHTDLHQWAEAADAFEQAAALARRAGDPLTRLLIEANRAELAIARGDLDEARRLCEHALLTAQETRETGADPELRKHLGVVARETGHYQEAERCFAEAEAMAMARGNMLLQAELSRERADLLARQGRFRDTVRNLNRSHQLFSGLKAGHDLADVDRRMLRIESSFLDVVRRWGESIESKDAYTQGHCLRVADLACAMARRTGLDERRLFWFRVGALLHDVGKIAVPPEILNKPGRLTSEEWALMRSHPEAGVELLRGIEFPEDVLPIVLHHHEKWDGSGYPHGLSGESIPAAARILGIADVYDALTTDRSYKPGMPHHVAMTAMREGEGTHFDPGLFQVFEAVVATRRDHTGA